MTEGSLQVEGDSLASVRYMEVNWGEKNGGVAEGREPFLWRGTREGKRERLRVDTRGKTSLDHGLGSEKY